MSDDINPKSDTSISITDKSVSRRMLLKSSAATVAMSVGSVGIVGGQNEETAEGPTTFEFNGVTGGWMAEEPESIAGEENPTLELTAGVEYTVNWVNGDGARHNFVIRDDEGSAIVRSEIIAEEGASQAVEFTATEEMVEYDCEIHPATMVGDVSVVAEDEEDDDEEEDRYEPPEPADTPEEIFEFVFENGEWIGQSPSSIEDQSNPDLELDNGETYEIEWSISESYSYPEDLMPNFVLVTEGGDVVTATEFLTEDGDTQTVPFVATNNLDSYYAQMYLNAQGEIFPQE